MTIDQAYRFILFVINKEQRGSFTPAQFNLLAPIAQMEVISNLLGNEELLNERGVPPYGYKSNRKIDTLLRPLVVGPVLIEPEVLTITAITKANPCHITFSNILNAVDGDLIYISGVNGMTQVNGNTYMLYNVAGNEADLKSTDGTDLNSSSFTTYSSGGEARTGKFEYPDNFIWPDAVHKMDWKPITIVDSDQLPGIKQSHLTPINSSYPVATFDKPLGYIDPIETSMFRLSYLGKPQDPYWAYYTNADESVYTASGSVDFAIHELGHQRICQKILQAVGVNLDSSTILNYAKMKESSGT